MSELLEAIKKIGAQVEDQGKQIAELKKKSANNPDPKRIFSIRKGENPNTSRPYSFLKAFGLYKGELGAEQCKVEVDIHNRMSEFMKSQGYEKKDGRNFLIPIWPDAMGDEAQELIREIKSATRMGAVDEDEVAYLRKKYYQKDLSWVTDTTGGTLVPLAAQGDLIELLRNQEALSKAGAQTFPLPPQGNISFPRQTSAMTAYWIGEKTSITKSDIGTGALVLRAKKLGVRGSIPNELFRYSNPAADAIVRNDIARVSALAVDLAGLEGTGGLQPTGLINLPSPNAIATTLATTVATNGNTFQPQDWSRLIGDVENANGIIDENSCAFICRPKFYRFTDPYRADAVSAGDKAGAFVELLKQTNAKAEKVKCGFPVVTSNQVSGARTKGSGTTLTYVIFGDWSQLLIGMGAAMELDMNPWGDTQWSTDQTEIRGITQVDIGCRNSASFGFIDTVLQA